MFAFIVLRVKPWHAWHSWGQSITKGADIDLFNILLWSGRQETLEGHPIIDLVNGQAWLKRK